jgi:preprotein translocase subunit Sss1
MGTNINAALITVTTLMLIGSLGFYIDALLSL